MEGTWTYDGNPAGSYFSAVRFQAGDTDKTNPQLSDGEIKYAMSVEPGNERLAAAIALDALASKYSTKASFTVGQISKQMGAIADNIRKHSARLRAEAGKLAVPFFGGLTQDGKNTLDQDTTTVQPPFKIGQFDSPLARQFDNQSNDPTIGQV